MELIVLGVIVLILYAAVRLFAALASSLSGARHRAYRQLAAKYRGRYENRGLVDPPTVSFPYNGASVRVGLAPNVAGQAAPARTRVVIRFGRGLPLRCELQPVTRPAPAQPPRGTRLVKSGDPEFDRAFVLQANDPGMARDFLQPPAARRAVEALRRLAPPGGMLVSINPERLLVQVDRNLGLHDPALEQAVREALVLHDQLQQGVAGRLSEGIAIVAVGPTPAAESEAVGPPTCKVCG
ncbi:MAG TPA: hypothetical protein VF590_01740, partial [Isosphaeraceae bacterium]